MEALDNLLAAALPYVPRPLVWPFARRYVAGNKLEDALRSARRLQEEGAGVTFDVLGENVRRASECRSQRDEVFRLLDALDEAPLEDATVSVKLTQFGLKLHDELCARIMGHLLARAAPRFVQIDMEDSSCTTPTLDLYRRLAPSHPNLGIVLQACLRRTPSDIDGLSELKPATRLCKGIYREPEALAHQGYEEVRKQYLLCLGKLLDNGHYVGIATHDPYLVERAEGEIARRGLGRDAYEFQMLLGVAETTRRQLIERGHRLRVYVPYGKQWFAYSTRRLKENPSIAGYILKNLFQR